MIGRDAFDAQFDPTPKLFQAVDPGTGRHFVVVGR
jgi:hypothetical protein